MTRNSDAWRLLAAIAVLTILSGLVQLVQPSLVLELVGAVISPTAKYFFGIIGLFMALFGGLLLQAMVAPTPQPVAALWAALQKFGACLAVLLGIYKGFFASTALLVAGFDLFAGLLAIWYWRTVRWPSS